MTTEAVSLSEAAYRRLRRDIAHCVLAPGERFSEDSLAERYGFGKAAIRSALVRLRHDGLVSGEPRRAHRVSAISPRDGAEINEMRLLLEPRPPAWRRCSGRSRNCARSSAPPAPRPRPTSTTAQTTSSPPTASSMSQSPWPAGTGESSPPSRRS